MNKKAKVDKPLANQSNKIGMCCFCGGSFSKSKTVMVDSETELCKRCAEQAGYDASED